MKFFIILVMSICLCSIASAQNVEKDSLSENKEVLRDHIKSLLSKKISEHSITGKSVSKSKYEKLRKLLTVDSTSIKETIPGKKVNKEVYEHVRTLILSNSTTKNQ